MFISKEMQQWLRQIRFNEQEVYIQHHRKKHSLVDKPEQIKESPFVKFLNRIENKGPQTPGSLHVKWTTSIREKMVKDNSWPTGTVDWNVEILARYLQELQKHFWNSLPKVVRMEFLPIHYARYPYLLVTEVEKLYSKRKLTLKKRYDAIDELRRSIRTFDFIHSIIRNKGLRDRVYIVSKGKMTVRFTRLFIDTYPTNSFIRWSVWSEEGCTIQSYSNEHVVTPFLVMPHSFARVNVRHDSQDRHMLPYKESDLIF